MKKLFCLILAGVMCFGLAACSDNGESQENGSVAAVSEENIPDVSIGEATGSGTEQDAETEAEEVTPVSNPSLMTPDEFERYAEEHPENMFETPDYPVYPASDLSEKKTLKDLTYMVDRSWKESALPAGTDGEGHTYESSGYELYVKSVPANADMKALIKEAQETNDWDGLLAIWVQDMIAPASASWYDAIQVYVPGAQAAWQVDARMEGSSLTDREVEEAQEIAPVTLNDNETQVRGLIVAGEDNVYLIWISEIDIFLSPFEGEWTAIHSGLQVGSGTDPNPPTVVLTPDDVDENEAFEDSEYYDADKHESVSAPSAG